MAYNWQMGAAPGVPEPSPIVPPARRPVGGRPVGRGHVVQTADGRTVGVRPPGTRLYVPGYHDDETEHQLMRQQLGLAIPIVPAISLVSGLFGGGADKKKYADRSKRLKAAIAARDLATLDLIASGYGGNWGTAYNPIKKSAKAAAAAIRSTPAAGVPASIPVPMAPPSPVTLIPQVPGVIPIPVTYTPPPSAAPTEMVPPPVPGPVATADAGGGFDVKSLVVPAGIGLGLYVLVNALGGKRRR